jgi:hypothetical protein
MREIPRHIIARDKQGVEALTYYGVPVTELDRDGLLAALNQSAKQVRASFEHFKANREFQAEMRRQERADYFLSGGLMGRR